MTSEPKTDTWSDRLGEATICIVILVIAFTVAIVQLHKNGVIK